MTPRTNTPRALARRDTTPRPKKRSPKAIDEARRGVDLSNASQEVIDATISPDKPLTDKQKLFTKFWAQGESIASACAKAGFANSVMGYQLTKYPNVLALYNAEKAKYEEAGQMTRKKVMDMLLESYDVAKMMSEPSSMVAAAREVGKMCGYYAPVESRVRIDVTGNVTHQRLSGMTDAELLEIIEQGRSTLAIPQ